jgi:L,D-transpeptidase YcbB
LIQPVKLVNFICLIAFLAIQPLLSLNADEVAMQESSISKEISAIITAKQHPYLKHPVFLNRSEDLDNLYKLANYQLLWLGNPQSAKNIADSLDLLANSTTQGLTREHYDIDLLRTKYKFVLSLPPTAYKELALYDTALSVTLLRFLHDLHYGRVNPKGINFNLQLREKKVIDLPLLIKDSITLHTVSQLPLLVEPKLHQYQKLKSALAAYRLIEQKLPKIPFLNTGKLRPGDHHPQLAELSQFLEILGDLPETDIINPLEKNPQYKPQLVEAVKKFQLRHGLGADGTIGPGTAEVLNEPISKRITQIELAMERLRWLPELNLGRSIIVNIPAFQLWAIDDLNNEASIESMRVVVGKALKNQTPVLMAQMSYIEFSPYWNVPKKILKDEILPKLIQRPNFLSSQNMEIVLSANSSAKPLPVSLDAIEKLKNGIYRVRQRPGKKNSLGKVKFIFPNKEDVYLHDTPANSLFSRSRRDFSHGCVRVEKPSVLAEFALKNQGIWNADTISKAMKNPVNQRVVLQKSIPVLFFYTTAFVDQNSTLAFYPDIYNHDNVLIEALRNPDDLSDQSIFVTNNVELPQTHSIP